MRLSVRLPLLLVALLGLCSPRASACVCMGSPERRGCASAGKQHDGVFVGRAMSSTRMHVPAAAGRLEGWVEKTSFHVTENFGRPLPTDVDIYVPASPPPRVENGHVIHIASSCDFSFEIGKDYLVFADMNNGRLSTNKCAGNRTLEKDDWVLQSLRHLPSPGTAYIEGVVSAERKTSDGSTDYRPVGEVTIQVEGQSVLEVPSDENGRFRVELPPGKYSVKAPLPPLYAPGPIFDFELIDQDCVMLDVRGRLRPADSN